MLRKWIVSLFLMLAMAVFTGIVVQVILLFQEKPSTTTYTPPPIQVEVMVVKKTPFSETITAMGVVEPRRVANVESEVTGRITYRNPLLEAGRKVKSTDLLLKVAPHRVALQLKLANIALNRANVAKERLKTEKADLKKLIQISRNNLKLAQKQAEDARKLEAKKISSQYEVDEAVRRVRSEKLALANLEARWNLIPVQVKEVKALIERRNRELELAQRVVDQSKVFPPFSGTILENKVDVGENTAMGKYFFTIVGRGRVVKVDFSAHHLPKLDLGQMAKVVYPSIPGQMWTGKLERIHPQIHPQNRTITGYVHLDGKETLPPVGVFAEVKLVVEKHEKIIALPRRALRGESEVYLLIDGKVVAQSVKIHATVDEMVLVSSGLAEGSRVILSRREGVIPGAVVEVRPSKIN